MPPFHIWNQKEWFSWYELAWFKMPVRHDTLVVSQWLQSKQLWCKSEYVAIWLKKRIIYFGFLSKIRVGIKLNLTFVGSEGETLRIQLENLQLWGSTCSVHSVHCCHLETGPPSAAQSPEQPLGRHLHCFPSPSLLCSKHIYHCDFFFKLEFSTKLQWREILPVTMWKVTVLQDMEQGVRNSEIGKLQRPTRSFTAAILQLISVQELCVLFLAAKELFMASMFSSQSEWGVQPGQMHQSNANHWQGIMNASWAEFKYNPWMRGKICMKERIIRIWFNKQYIKWAFASLKWSKAHSRYTFLMKKKAKSQKT